MKKVKHLKKKAIILSVFLAVGMSIGFFHANLNLFAALCLMLSLAYIVLIIHDVYSVRGITDGMEFASGNLRIKAGKVVEKRLWFIPIKKSLYLGNFRLHRIDYNEQTGNVKYGAFKRTINRETNEEEFTFAGQVLYNLNTHRIALPSGKIMHKID